MLIQGSPATIFADPVQPICSWPNAAGLPKRSRIRPVVDVRPRVGFRRQELDQRNETSARGPEPPTLRDSRPRPRSSRIPATTSRRSASSVIGRRGSEGRPGAAFSGRRTRGLRAGSRTSRASRATRSGTSCRRSGSAEDPIRRVDRGTTGRGDVDRAGSFSSARWTDCRTRRPRDAVSPARQRLAGPSSPVKAGRLRLGPDDGRGDRDGGDDEPRGDPDEGDSRWSTPKRWSGRRLEVVRARRRERRSTASRSPRRPGRRCYQPQASAVSLRVAPDIAPSSAPGTDPDARPESTRTGSMSVT